MILHTEDQGTPSSAAALRREPRCWRVCRRRPRGNGCLRLIHAEMCEICQRRCRPLNCEDADDKWMCEVTPTPLLSLGVTPMEYSLTPPWQPFRVLATGGCAKRGSLLGWYEYMACPALQDACPCPLLHPKWDHVSLLSNYCPRSDSAQLGLRGAPIYHARSVISHAPKLG